MDPDDFDDVNVVRPRNVENIRNLVLTNAIKAGNLDSVIQVLTDYDMEINTLIDGAWPAFLIAALHAQFDIMVHFLNLGADPLISNNFFNALMAVCSSSCTDEEVVVRCIRLLLNQGLPVNEKDQQRTTALMMAAKNGHLAAVQELIARNANLDIQDYEGWSAIFHATSQNHFDIVKLLVENGASVKLVDRRSRTLVEIAETKGFDDIVEFIRKDRKENIVIEEPEVPVSLNVRDYKDMVAELPGNNEFLIDVSSFLHNCYLSRYTRQFHNQGINLGKLLNMNDSDLKEAGVVFSAHRKLILSSIKKFHLSQWRNCFGLNVEERLYSDRLVFTLANITRHLYTLNQTTIFIKTKCPREVSKRFSSDFKDIILRSVDQLEIIESCMKRLRVSGKQMQRYDRIKYVDLIGEKSLVIKSKFPTRIFLILSTSLSILLSFYIVRRRI